MKYILFSLLLLTNCAVRAQITRSTRRINFRSIGRDSVNLSLNDEYFLIEDSCAQIVRYSRLNFQQRLFFGKFKDVNKANPAQLISEGNYNTSGLKDGEFTEYYLNGNLEAKGIFKENKYEGRWEINYENGKPRLIFDASNGNCTIVNAWSADGVKTVDNGNGIYQVNFESMHWKGKLMNGKPDGQWKLSKNDDVSNVAYVTEYFKKGIFQKGVNPMQTYTDSSHITLVDPGMLPLVNAEKMLVSRTACNESKIKHAVTAQYTDGFDSFSEEIKKVVSPYFNKLNIKSFESGFTINGMIDERGELTNMKSNDNFNLNVVQGVIQKLYNLPLLHPATLDGKPVKQKFTITFIFEEGMYKFSYRFLPLE